MPISNAIVRLLVAPAVMLSVVSPASAATPSTSQGRISVAQVIAMLDQQRSNPTARQVLTAYLSGVGETAGTLTDLEGTKGKLANCKTRFDLNPDVVRHALASVATDRRNETPATPIILRDMARRAGCTMMP